MLIAALMVICIVLGSFLNDGALGGLPRRPLHQLVALGCCPELKLFFGRVVDCRANPQPVLDRWMGHERRDDAPGVKKVVGLGEPLEAMVDHVRRPPHHYRVSSLNFAELDLERIKKDRRLEERGRERGECGHPPENAPSFDDVEVEIIEFVESEKRQAHEQARAHLGTYAERLHGLDFESRFATLESHGREGIADFRAEVNRGIDELHIESERVREAENDMREFREENGLRRGAYYPSKGLKVILVGVLLLLLLFETVANGYFLAKGSEYGLIGGISEAFLLAFLNLGISFFFGRLLIPNLAHRRILRALAGVVALICYLGFVAVFNLAVAHYRETTGTLLEGAGAKALERFWASPTGLDEFQSWVLFGIGVLFALIAFVDALFHDDPYPGYGRVTRRLEAAREAFVEERNRLLDELADRKAETVDAIRSAMGDLGKRRSEYAAILEAWKRTCESSDAHQDHLERSANALLLAYREANRASRRAAPPEHFGEEWKMERLSLEKLGPETWSLAKLDREIGKAQKSLTKMIEEVLAEYEKAFSKYQRLTDLRKSEDVQAPEVAQ